MKALVTGGGGFLGGKIAAMLHERGDNVVALGRSRYPDLSSKGITTVQADVRDSEAISEACRGMDVVFHVAALAAIWGPRKEFLEINVDGTRNVISGCRTHKVPKLVYTSSPSVVFGEDDLCGIDESVPYPDRYLAHYPETKAIAERLVKEANSPDLSTIALRPHLIWGPGDPHLIPRVIDRAKKGQLLQVGDGENLVDIIYVDNAAEAHLLAAKALEPGSACAGQAYFLSQGEPVALWPWLNEILRLVKVPEVSKTLSYKNARRIGSVMESLYRVFRIQSEPRMTRFLASQLAKSHYFDISRARQDLAYEPKVSTEQGLRKLIVDLGENEAGECSPRSF